MSQADIHPTAIIADGAKLAEGVKVGPYAIIEDHVEIGANTVIGPHVVIHSYVRMGESNKVHAHAVIGDLPQDVSFDGRETWVEIGDNNTLREGFTIHRSTNAEQPTRMGSDCYCMAYSHVGHDCQIGSGVILTIDVSVGGHVQIGDKAVLGGGTVVHQFVRIGDYAMVAGLVAVRRDVMPYTMVAGEPLVHYRLNSVGLRRNGIKGDNYRAIESAFRTLRSGGSVDDIPDSDALKDLRDWLSAPSKRGLTEFLGEGVKTSA